MSRTPKILAFAGSARRDSYNKKVVAVAAEGARRAGAEVTLLDLADYPLPVYDGDTEEREGIPGNAARFRDQLKAHDGLLIASPEYNGSITPLLKNLIDWTSRPDGDDAGLVAYRGKVAGLLGASPGSLGGLRALRHVREILSGINVLVIPEQRAVPKAHEIFDEQGHVTDDKIRAGIEAIGAKLAEMIARLEG